MKRCPACGRDYYDDSLSYCLDDGSELLFGPAKSEPPVPQASAYGSLSEPGAAATGFPDEPQTAILSKPGAVATGSHSEEATTQAFIHTTAAEARGSLDSRSERPSLSANRTAKPRKSFDKRLILVPLVLAVIVGGYFGYRYFQQDASGQINSIAVLPFVNPTGNTDSEYLSDGLAESLIYRLSQLPDLKVSPTSSVFRYKGKEADPQAVAKELGVDSVMTGRITQRGDNLNISVNLVDTRNGKSLWGEQYERKMSELLATQREITAEITNKLQLKLSGNEKGLAKNYTDSNEAYQLYLKGRYFWNKRTGESLKQAVELFDQAVAKDPNFALAYSGLAESYSLYPNYSVALPLDSMPKAKEAALKAIELDDLLAEPHVALGIYYADFAWNQPKAEQEFRRAIELNPNYATAHQQFGVECLTAMGRFDEAIAEGKRAVELDPLSPIISADFGNIYFRARRIDEALIQLERARDLDPNFFVTQWYLGMVYQAKGRLEESIAAFRKSVELSNNPWSRALLIRALAKAGKQDEAVKILGELRSDADRRVVSSASLAMAYGGVGDKDKAFFYLEKEVNERNSRPPLFANYAIWDDLRDDPRFTALVKKVEQSKLD